MEDLATDPVDAAGTVLHAQLRHHLAVTQAPAVLAGRSGGLGGGLLVGGAVGAGVVQIKVDGGGPPGAE